MVGCPERSILVPPPVSPTLVVMLPAMNKWGTIIWSQRTNSKSWLTLLPGTSCDLTSPEWWWCSLSTKIAALTGLWWAPEIRPISSPGVMNLVGNISLSAYPSTLRKFPLVFLHPSLLSPCHTFPSIPTVQHHSVEENEAVFRNTISRLTSRNLIKGTRGLRLKSSSPSKWDKRAQNSQELY